MGEERKLEIVKRPIELRSSYRRVVEELAVDLYSHGLLGEHKVSLPQLHSMSEGGFFGQLGGSIFRLRGNLYGEGQSGAAFTFSWENQEGGLVISQVPFDRLEIQKAESEESSVRFKFNLGHFVKLDEAALTMGKFEAAITRVAYDHPNEYLIPEALVRANFRLNEIDFEVVRKMSFGGSATR